MEKIEFIKKKDAPSKFRAIINVNEEYNVGVTLNRTDLKGIFYQIKNMLEERCELNEPEFSKMEKKEVVVQEVIKEVEVEKEITIQNVVEFLVNADPELVDRIFNKIYPEDETQYDNEEIIVLLDDEAKTETPIDLSVLMNEDLGKNKKKKGGIFGIWSLLLVVGSGVVTFSLTNPNIFKNIKEFIGM